MDTDSESLAQARVVNIVFEELQEEFCQVSADLAFWSAESANKEADLQAAKYALDRVCALQGDMIKAHLKSHDGKVTVRELDDALLRSQTVQKAQDRHVEAIRERNVTRGMMFAIKTKSDMLVSLAQLLRAELKNEPRTYKE